MNSNESVAKSIYAAFGQGDVPAIIERLDPQIHWSFYGPAEIPFAGEHHGHEEIVSFFTTVGATVEVLSFEPMEFISSGENVVVLGREKVRVPATDRIFKTNWAHVYTFRNGLVVRLQEYYDTAALVAAFTPEKQVAA